MRVTTTDDRHPQLSFEGLVNWLKDQFDDPQELFLSLASAAPRLDRRLHDHPERPVNSPAAFATLMAAALACPWPSPSGQPHAPRPLTSEALDSLCSLAIGACLPDGYDQLPDDDWMQVQLFAQLSTQRTLQWDQVSVQSRYLVASGLTGHPAYCLDDDPLIAKVIEQETSVGKRAFLDALMLVSYAAQTHPFVRPDVTFEAVNDRDVQTALRWLLEQLSLRPDEARVELLTGRCAVNPGTARGYSLFIRKPLIRLSNGFFVAAPSAFAAIAIASLPYTELREASAKVDFGDGQIGRLDNELTRQMGFRFETMVNSMLAVGMPNPAFSFIGERLVGNQPSEVKSPDGLFVDSRGKAAVLVQSKLRVPNLSLWHGAPVEREQALWDPYGRMLNQSIRFLRWVENERANCVDEEAVRIKRLVGTCDDWYLLCVSPIVPGIFHMGTVENALWELVCARQKGRAGRTINDWRRAGRLHPPHIASFETLEFLAALSPTRLYPQLYDEWRSYLATFRPRRLGQDDFPADFRNFLAFRFQGSMIARPESREPHRNLAESALSLFGQPKEAHEEPSSR